MIHVYTLILSCITAVHFYSCTGKLCLCAGQRRVLKCQTCVCDAFVQLPIQPKAKRSADHEIEQQVTPASILNVLWLSLEKTMNFPLHHSPSS